MKLRLTPNNWRCIIIGILQKIFGFGKDNKHNTDAQGGQQQGTHNGGEDPSDKEANAKVNALVERARREAEREAKLEEARHQQEELKAKELAIKNGLIQDRMVTEGQVPTENAGEEQTEQPQQSQVVPEPQPEIKVEEPVTAVGQLPDSPVSMFETPPEEVFEPLQEGVIPIPGDDEPQSEIKLAWTDAPSEIQPAAELQEVETTEVPDFSTVEVPVEEREQVYNVPQEMQEERTEAFTDTAEISESAENLAVQDEAEPEVEELKLVYDETQPGGQETQEERIALDAPSNAEDIDTDEIPVQNELLLNFDEKNTTSEVEQLTDENNAYEVNEQPFEESTLQFDEVVQLPEAQDNSQEDEVSDEQPADHNEPVDEVVQEYADNQKEHENNIEDTSELESQGEVLVGQPTSEEDAAQGNNNIADIEFDIDDESDYEAKEESHPVNVETYVIDENNGARISTAQEETKALEADVQEVQVEALEDDVQTPQVEESQEEVSTPKEEVQLPQEEIQVPEPDFDERHEESQQEVQEEQQEELPPKKPSASGKKTFLVVDDANFMRILLKKILEEGGYEIIGEAANGREAIDLVKKLAPDVVTLDITMPEVDGMTALQEILALRPETKVIMCSAMNQREMVLQSLKLGAKDFISKPFEQSKVLEVIQRVVNMK